MKPLNMSESHKHRRRRQTVAYNAITLCFLVFWADSVAMQRTGEKCELKTGDVGVCQLLTQCKTARRGEKPTVCGIKEDIPIVCCRTSPTDSLHIEAPQEITQKKQPPPFINQYHLLDTEVHEVPSVDFPVNYPRGDRNEPWRKTEKPIAENSSGALQNSQSSNNNGDVTHHQGTAQPKIQPLESIIRKRRQPRISETKCNEYSKLATSKITGMPLLLNPEPVNVEIPTCEFNSVPLIVGGEEAKLKEFPHMAALGYLENGRMDWKCGGSLISEYYVLTAAHCTPRNNPPTVARLGDLNLKVYNDGAQPVNYLVVGVIRHPDYKAPSKYNDIALLKLDRQVEFNEFIRPACLYISDTFEINKTVATGWGKIDYAEKKSDNLLKVVLSIIDNNLCNELYQSDEGSRQLKNGIVQSMMCAGELEGGKDTCQGDSGGPIQVTRPDNQCTYSIIGVTSFGKFCAAKNSPGVYTRVSSFVPWIESTVWPE